MEINKNINFWLFLGDRNLHLQISLKKYTESEVRFYENIVYDKVKQLNGSISAEHGIGFLKKGKLKQVKSKSTLNLMTNIKTLMDPNKILNPYKVLT